MQLKAKWFLLALAGIVIARLFSMAAMPLIDTSEPRYAEIARLMAETGDWITPWFEPGVPFWGKPPLSFWSQAMGIRILGGSEFAVRLPSFLAMVALAAMLYRATAILVDRQAARWTTLILSSMLLPLAAAGAVLTDSFLALGITYSMLAFLVAPTAPTPFWRYGFFVGIAIGLLSKGPLAFVLLGIVLVPWLALYRDRRAVARKVIMSHFAQSKSEPLFRTVEAFRAKADDASEGTVDANPCAQGPRVVTARDRATLGRISQYGGSIFEVRGCPTLQAA